MEYYNTTGKSVQDGILQDIKINDLEAVDGKFSGAITSSNLSSGQFSFVGSNVLNLDTFDNEIMHYQRVGNYVFFQGFIDLNTVASLETDFSFLFTLPIATTFTLDASDGLGEGTCVVDGSPDNFGAIRVQVVSGTSTTQMVASFTLPTGVNNVNLTARFSGSYLIK